MEELLPSEVRERIMKEHLALRARMQGVRSCRADSVEALAREIETLLAAIRDVVELENELLLPTLRGIDAWGPERARRLAAWHLDVSEHIENMRSALAETGRSLDALASRARAFVDELERELGTGEQDHLADELLRELPIRADLGGD